MPVNTNGPEAPPRVLVWAAVLLLLAGCHGNDSTPTPIPCMELDFQEAISAIAAGDVFLARGAASCSTVDVAVMVNNLTGIWTVGFDLVYPSSAIRYDSYTLGPLLQKGNPANPPVVFMNPTASGLQVTMSRLQPDPGVDAVGAEELIRFRFQKVASGTGIIDFDSSSNSTVSETILDSAGNPRPASFGPQHGGLVMVP
jgi:hypothetical protein